MSEAEPMQRTVDKINVAAYRLWLQGNSDTFDVDVDQATLEAVAAELDVLPIDGMTVGLDMGPMTLHLNDQADGFTIHRASEYAETT